VKYIAIGGTHRSAIFVEFIDKDVIQEAANSPKALFVNLKIKLQCGRLVDFTLRILSTSLASQSQESKSGEA
jgi:hypothetical protein